MWASANALAQSLFTPSQTISIIGLFLIIGAATLTHGHLLPPISVRFLVIWAFLLVIYTFTHITLQLALVSEILTAVAFICLYVRTLKGITSMQRTLWVGILFLLFPFFERIHQLINFPFRVFATQIVSLLFQLFGYAHTTSTTIISIENKAAYVDIPCSGLRSIHTGLMVFIALCLMYRPSLLRIILAGIASLCVLLSMNIWRIFNIVWIDALWKKPDLAATLHIWLGLIGFAIACGFMMRVLRTTTSNASSKHIDDISIQNAHSHA
jgi:exosortase O